MYGNHLHLTVSMYCNTMDYHIGIMGIHPIPWEFKNSSNKLLNFFRGQLRFGGEAPLVMWLCRCGCVVQCTNELRWNEAATSSKLQTTRYILSKLVLLVCLSGCNFQ